MFGADRRVGDHVDRFWYGFCRCPRLHQLLIGRGTTKTRRPLGGKTLFVLKRCEGWRVEVNSSLGVLGDTASCQCGYSRGTCDSDVDDRRADNEGK